MQANIMAQLKAGVANGQLLGGYGYAPNQWYLTGGALSTPPNIGKQVNSWEDLIANMQPGDVANIGPGFYAEGNLVIPESLTNVTFRGMGNRGACGIEASITTDEGLTVLADDVTLINLGVAGGDTGDYSLQVGSQTVSPNRFRAYGCKFENAAIAVRLWQAGDVILDDCEICWTTLGLVLRSGDIGFNTQIRIQNCLLHNYVTGGIVEHAAAQQVNDLWLVDNVFGRQEDGTAGTDDILLSDNGNTGLITGNRFSRATNGTGFITIGTGLIYNPNGTEAGWSTARPA
jgi:hypothetical protein